jgi:hypothetical protein
MAADCEGVHAELSTRFYYMDAYLRLNVDRGMENLAMDVLDKLGDIGSYTYAYSETAAVSEALEASLKRLQGGTGTMTLDQMSKSPLTKSDVVPNFHLLMVIRSSGHRQERAGQARTAGAGFRTRRQSCERQR